MELNHQTREKIEALLTEHKIVLFMKGSPESPLCGFSARACSVLDDLGVTYHTVNVLEDMEIRNGIKEYGQWPTIPQLYVRKSLVGGSDILLEMHQSGELKELIEKS